MIKDALVSFWNSPDSTDRAHFVGSGFFIAPARVLTAKHLIQGSGGLWLRPEAGAIGVHPVVAGGVTAHEKLDAAVVTLEAMPVGATVLRPFLGKTQPDEVRLNGYFEGRREAPHPYGVTRFDEGEAHYLLSSKQPKGQSGSAACIGARVWGMTVRHYDDPNIHRGCAIAIHQLWEWLRKQIPDLDQILPPPSWDDWVADMRGRLKASFDSQVFASVFGSLEDGLPKPLAKALEQTDPATLGERCVEALIDSLKQAARRLKDGSAVLGYSERNTAREGLLDAMGVSVRLCLNPEMLPCRVSDDGSGLDAIIDLEAMSPASAAIVTGLNRAKCWEESATSSGIPTFRDKLAHAADFEMGEGPDRQKEIARLIHKILFPSNALPGAVSKAVLSQLRGYLRSEAKEGRARLLVLEGELSPALRQELAEWLQSQLGISLLLLRDPEDDSSPYYLCDEAELLARIYEFVKLVNQPEWNPA